MHILIFGYSVEEKAAETDKNMGRLQGEYQWQKHIKKFVLSF